MALPRSRSRSAGRSLVLVLVAGAASFVLSSLPGAPALVARAAAAPASAAPAKARSATAAPTAPDPMMSIDALRSEVTASSLDGSQRDAIVAILETAAAEEREARSVRERIAGLRAEAEESAAQTDDAEPSAVEPGISAAQWGERVAPRANTEDLEALLDQQREIATDLTARIDQLEAELAQILARPTEIATEMASLHRDADARSTPIATADEEPPLSTEARALRQQSELHRLQAELELRRVEQDTSVERQRLRERKAQALRARQRLVAERIEWLQSRVASEAKSELDERIARLDEQEKSFATRPGLEAQAAKENHAIGHELLDQNERLTEDRERLSEIEQERDRVAAALKDSRTRIDLGGTNEAVGRWLWSERRRLEPAVRLRRALDDVRSQLAELRLRRVTESEERSRLDDIPAAARALREASELQAADEGKDEDVVAKVEPLLRQRVELLTLLEPILQRRIKTLEQTESVSQERLDQTQSLRQLLDRHLLWIPSHAPLDSTWLKRAPEGLADLLKVSRWKTTFELVRDEVSAKPLPWVASFLLLAVLFELRRRAPAKIEALAALTRQIGADHIGVTLTTFGWTFVAALPWPALLVWVGQLLQRAGTPGRYSDSLGRTCSELVMPLLAVQVLRWTIVEQGLAHAHFRWMRARREALRRTLPRAAAIVLPMYFITSLAFIRNLDLPNDVQARIAIFVACLVLALTFARLFEAGQVWVHRGIEVEPSNVRRALRVALPAFSLFIALLALSGYVYSAHVLLNGILSSVGVLVSVGLAIGLLSRWFLLGERSLARKRHEERSAQAEQAAASDPEGGSREVASQITLEQVNSQTRSLLRALRIALLLIGLVWIWANVLPAITRLDEIALWTFDEIGPDGVRVVHSVSLMAALFGGLALALTVVSARNLPGLVELGLLSRTSIDPASRYAISSLLRYAIAITGSLVGLQLLGMRWSQLQWLAAALTVGLGFGLQEIFANFVSGLILLFERPFRVGDVITVGDLSGRVSRIRTRATTIADFDGKEIFVPNKSFITGTLLNWTLSDTKTRIIVKVGVAYGTEPDRVHALLMRAAMSNPQVLHDPPPQSLFVAFATAGLDFELRVFVGTLADRGPVQSGLHREIVRLFAENDVEMAIQQLPPLARRPAEPELASETRPEKA